MDDKEYTHFTTDILLKEYEEIIQSGLYPNSFVDSALLRLLKVHKEYINGLIESDSTGAWFHKAFRQTDVTPSGDIDMAIWYLLQEAPLFWQIVKDNNDPNKWEL